MSGWGTSTLRNPLEGLGLLIAHRRDARLPHRGRPPSICIFAGPINVAFKRTPIALGAAQPLMVAGKPVTMEDLEEMEEEPTLGVGKVEDFTWKGLLDFGPPAPSADAARVSARLEHRSRSRRSCSSWACDHAYARARGSWRPTRRPREPARCGQGRGRAPARRRD